MEIEIKSNKEESFKDTINLLLWGVSGVGKTTLAATLPNPLFLMFDTNGSLSLKFLKKEVLTLDMNTIDSKFIKNAYGNISDPLGIKKIIEKYGIKSIILDSATSFEPHIQKYSTETTSKAEFDMPTLQSYQKKFIALQEIIKNTCAFCTHNNLNFCCIAHEAPLVKDDMTGMVYKTFSMTGKLPSIIPSYFDEVWYMSEINSKKYLKFKQDLKVFPMKTRLFDTSLCDNLLWEYDLNNPNEDEEIGSWIKTQTKQKINSKGKIEKC